MCNASIALSPCCSNSSARLLISYRPYGERLPGLNSGLPGSCVTETDFDCFRTLTPMRSPASRFPPRSSGESQQKQVFPARSWAASGHQMACYIRWYPDRLSPLSSASLIPRLSKRNLRWGWSGSGLRHNGVSLTHWLIARIIAIRCTSVMSL